MNKHRGCTDTEWLQFARSLPSMSTEQLASIYPNTIAAFRDLIREEVARRTSQFQF